MKVGSSPVSVIFTGLGIAALGFAGRIVLRQLPLIEREMNKILKNWQTKGNLSQTEKFAKYYRGGFDKKMNAKEASLILGVNQNAKKRAIKAAFLRAIASNHPDRGGSPYIASKINEANDYLQSRRK